MNSTVDTTRWTTHLYIGTAVPSVACSAPSEGTNDERKPDVLTSSVQCDSGDSSPDGVAAPRGRRRHVAEHHGLVVLRKRRVGWGPVVASGSRGHAGPRRNVLGRQNNLARLTAHKICRSISASGRRATFALSSQAIWMSCTILPSVVYQIRSQDGVQLAIRNGPC